MPRNLIVRVGLDPSGYNSGMAKLPKTAESVSKKVKKSLGQHDLSQSVGKAMGWSGAASDAVTQVNADSIANAKQQLADLIEYRKQMQSIGFDENSADAQYGAVSERIRELSYDIQAYESELQRQADAQRVAGQAAQDSSQQTVSAAHQAASAHREEAAAVEESTGSTRRSIHPIRSLGQWLQSIRSHIPGIRKTSDAVGNIGVKSLSSSLSIGRMVNAIRRISLVSFAFRIAGSALGRLRSIVSQYISENDALQAQVNGLKSAMGQALAPAINLVVNAMSALLPYVVGISNAIGQLMGALFGSGWTVAANGAKQMSAATGGAAKAQKELNRQLMSFDEINKLNADNSSSGGGGGSTGSGISQIESKIPSWMESFRNTFSDLFNSDEFKASNIGGKIGMIMQTGLDWLGSGAIAFDWSGAGKTLRENFDSFMESGWVDSLFSDVGIFLVGFSDFVAGLLSPEMDKLLSYYQEAGASGIAAYLVGFLVGLPTNIFSWVCEHIFSPMFSGMAKYFEERGNDSAAGYLKGISDSISGAGQWIKENVTDPVVNFVKELFGIHSPSTVFEDIGILCMSGYTGGLERGFSGVLQKLGELKEKIFSVSDTIKEAFSFDWKMPNLKLPHLSVNWDPVDNVLARFFGVSAFPRLSVSWYAKGGILSGAQIFGRMGSTLLGGGEAGKEAVLPLEGNTGWMDKIADRVVSMLSNENGGDINATIYLTLDSEVLNRTVIKGLRKYARANGGTGL